MTYKQMKRNYDEHNYEDRYCLKCGKKLTIQQVKINSKFCSNSCANSYNSSGRKLSEEHKSNIRNGLINSLKYKESLAKRREENKRREEQKQLKNEENRQKRKEENKQRRKLLQIFEQILGKKLIKRYPKKKTKQINCKICGRPLIDGKCQNDFCIKHKNTKFEKLSKYFGFDISKYGTELVETEFNRIREMLYDLYWNKHMSSVQFESMFNLKKNTIFHYFKLFDIPTKTLSFAIKESIQENRTKISISEHFKGNFHTHITWDNKEVHLRSINEVEYAKQLDSQKIIYEVESLRIKYFDTQKNDYRYAIPDFYLPETNTIIEVKSSFTLDVINMKDRCKEFTNLGYNFKLIFDFKEMTLDEILKNNLYDYDKNKNILKRIYENKKKDGGQWINKNGIVKKCYKQKDLEQYLNDGWSLGTGNHRKTAGTSKVVRLNEHGFLEYKLIPRSELKEYLNNGWFKGKTLKYEILELLKQKSD